jgi:hypothetical protein
MYGITYASSRPSDPGMMILGLNAITLGGHLGGGRHPDARPATAMNLAATATTTYEEPGRVLLAAYGAETLFGSATDKHDAQVVYADIKGRMARYGR